MKKEKCHTKILIIQLRQLGDILLTTPVLQAIKESHPDSHITFLSHRMGKLILEGNPYLDDLWVYEDNENLLAEIRRYSRIRKAKFDIVFDFMNNPKSALYTLVSGAKHRYGFKSSRSFAYNHVIENTRKQKTYIVDEKFLLLEEAGFRVSRKNLYIPLEAKHDGPILEFQKIHHLIWSQSPVKVVLSPTHRRDVRKWPQQNYILLAERLVREWGALIMWAWGPGEEAEVEDLVSRTTCLTYKAPKTSLRELASLMKHFDLFVGNSNGPSHLAVAVDLASLQLHGHTSMVSWCPLTSRHRAIQSADFGKTKMPTLDSISVDQVFQELTDMRQKIQNQSVSS